MNAAGALDYNVLDAAAVGALRSTGDNIAVPMSGDISEIILYSLALSAVNRATVEAYLNARYAIY